MTAKKDAGFLFVSLVQRATDQEAVSGYLQDPDQAVQSTEEPPVGDHTEVGAQGCPETDEAGAAPQTRHLGRAIRPLHQRDAVNSGGEFNAKYFPPGCVEASALLCLRGRSARFRGLE